MRNLRNSVTCCLGFLVDQEKLVQLTLVGVHNKYGKRFVLIVLNMLNVLSVMIK